MAEIWKDIKGFEGWYQVSSLGKIKGLERQIPHSSGGLQTLKEKTLKPAKDSKGYYIVILCKNSTRFTRKVARLVAQAFIPNLHNKPQINHINGIKTDNRLENLEWCTNSENQKHAHKIGLKIGKKGENHWKAILNEKQIRVIKHCLNIGMRITNISKCFSINQNIISKIKAGTTWSHITI